MVFALVAVSVLNALCAIPLARRARRDYARLGRTSLPVAIWSGVVMHGHAAITLALAWLDRGSLAEPTVASLAFGIGIAAIGGGILIAGRRAYGGRARVYGLLEDRLFTEGVYRRSRNPQYVGYWLTLLGAATAGLSLWAFLLALVFAILVHFWVTTVEEPHLRAAFGEDYSRYCASTSRYIGIRRATTQR